MKINGKDFNFSETKHEISQDDVKSFNEATKNIFDFFDKNGDKKLSQKELNEAFSIFSKMDNAGGKADGVLTDDEIKAGLKNLPQNLKASVDDIKNFIGKISALQTGKSLAKELMLQISGISFNKNTMKLLDKITPDNVVDVLQEYSKLSPGESLASAINNEWSFNSDYKLDLDTIKQKICKNLVEKAKTSGLTDVYHGQYLQLKNIKEVNTFINSVITKLSTVQKNKESDSVDLIRLTVDKYNNVVNKDKDIDYEYWSELVDKISSKYNVSKEILIGIIAKETGGTFAKNENNKTGKGPMQITGIAVKAFFPNAKGSWHDLYKDMNPELLNDILYVKDANGNPTNKLKYSSATELRDACAKDDELGILVGLLAFEMNYVQAVAKEKYGSGSYKNIPKTINGLKDNSITLTANQTQKCIFNALKSYNGVPSEKMKTQYATSVTDSLSIMGVKYDKLEIL